MSEITLTDEQKQQVVERLNSIKIADKICKDTVKNPELSLALLDVLEKGGVEDGCEKSKGSLFYTIGTELRNSAGENRDALAKYVGEDKITSSQQLKAAFSFLKKLKEGELISENSQAFEQATGVGVTVTVEQIQSVIEKIFEENAEELEQKKHSLKGKLIGKLKSNPDMKWANGKDLMSEFNKALIAKIGEPVKQQKKKKNNNNNNNNQGKKSNKNNNKEEEYIPVRPKDCSKIKLTDILKYENKNIEVSGWIHNIRKQKKTYFFTIRDTTGFIQCVVGKNLVNLPSSIDLIREACITVCGNVTRPPKKNHAPYSGLEIQVEYWELLGKSDISLEERLNRESNVSVLFDQRHLALRQEELGYYLKLRSVVTQKMREHYFEKDYFEVTPPTIVQTQAEGGSELFKVDYYGEEAYLTQSSQLYLETVCPSVGKCFCLLSSYRAEESKTRRHLAEYSHLEAEMPFVTFDDLLNEIEDLVCDTVQRVLDSKYGEMLLKVNPDAKVPKRPFKRMNYTDAITWLRENNVISEKTGKLFEFGEDIPEKPERFMVDTIGEPIFLCRFPVEIKAFYMPKCPEDPRLTDSTDLLVPNVGEIVGGSMRINDYNELISAYEREGIDHEPYYWFTDQRKFGSFPHGGYGLGLERFLCWLFNEYHIRNVCLYPRYIGRCKP
eukprot:TRINITY_DN1159_c0_g1_i1.p1 TRINITY_DN1159_c0_g1~~TRINITY_DN1159_c0_g1_i1.p1  ORF type:complete len:668 (+),score=284.11 TRINITY_DN1159_c0_g1_i1:96-2099(+)